MVPIVGSAKRAIRRPSVVLPEPVEPTIATCWPAGIVTSMFLSTAESEPVRSRLGYENVTSRMSMRSLPAGSGDRVVRRRRTDREVEHRQHAAQAGHGVLGLVEHLGELGDRLEEPVREEDEADQRARRETARRSHPHAHEHDGGDRERGEDLARGEQEGADERRPDLRPRLDLDRVLHSLFEHLTGVVRPDGGRARHDFGDGAEHVAVGVARPVVGPHQSRLHGAQHERQRHRHGERDQASCQL